VAHVHVVHHRSYSDTGDDDDGRETTVEEAGPVRYQDESHYVAPLPSPSEPAQQPAPEYHDAAARAPASAAAQGNEGDFRSSADAIIGPAPTGSSESGFKKRGSITVAKVDANGYYYLNVAGIVGHSLHAVIQGSDGFHRSYQGYGQIYSGPVKAGGFGTKDYLQVQDLTTGETQYFRFAFL